MLDKILAILFWLFAAVVAWSYVVYPAVIALLAKAFGKTQPPEMMSDQELPNVCLLIAAHNEEAVIAKRMQNALELDYPAEKLHIVIGSDGSSDSTAQIVRALGDARVKVLDYAQRRGKASVLNSALSEIEQPVILFSDANTFYEPSAARLLVRWLRDEKVGIVCGKLILTESGTGKNVDSIYWKYETFLKEREGSLGALLGSNGAIYAMRRQMYVPIPANTIVDDFVIPLLAKLRHHCRIVYDPQAVAHEETAPHISDEFRRRARIGAGGFQAIGMLWPLLNPLHGWIALSFFSHKVLRWLCPLALLGMLIINAMLWGHPLYRTILLVQALFYLLSALGPLIHMGGMAGKLLRLPTMFTGMNLALLVGFWSWLLGSHSGAWRRTRRSSEWDSTSKSVYGAAGEHH